MFEEHVLARSSRTKLYIINYLPLLWFQEPVLLQDSKEECEKENSDCCEEEDESESTCSTSEHEETEKNSNLSKEERKLQRKVLRPVEVNFNICYTTF